ncbi:MAG: hypothetical protein MJ099_03025 [Clostridia bacterium]|nr:hypothetical protein [Clostridia bacterium]
MKRFIAFILTVALLTVTLNASAEAPAIIGKMSGGLGDIWNAVVDTATDVFEEVSEVVSVAADDFLEYASEAGEQAWAWAQVKIGEAWVWTKENAAEVWDWAGVKLGEVTVEVTEWIKLNGPDILDQLHVIFVGLLDELGINSENIEAIWNEVMAYADSHNIKPSVMAKLVLAIIVRFVMAEDVDMQGAADVYIKEVLAQWFSDFSVDTNEEAESALEGLEDSLAQFQNN